MNAYEAIEMRDLQNQLEAESQYSYLLKDENEALKKRIDELNQMNEFLKKELHEAVKETRHLDDVITEQAEQIRELERFKLGMFEEIREIESELAPALGYGWEDDYGWVTGDHTIVSLAMEARATIKELESYQTEPGCI